VSITEHIAGPYIVLNVRHDHGCPALARYGLVHNHLYEAHEYLTTFDQTNEATR
jgi:hypothetical protein